MNLREKMNVSQVGLARMVGLSATTLSKYEKNLREPRADVIVKIADALSTSSDFLLCRTDDSSPLEKSAAWLELSDEEQYIVHSFRLLGEREKGRLLERLQTLYEQHAKKDAAFTIRSNEAKDAMYYVPQNFNGPKKAQERSPR